MSRTVPVDLRDQHVLQRVDAAARRSISAASSSIAFSRSASSISSGATAAEAVERAVEDGRAWWRRSSRRARAASPSANVGHAHAHDVALLDVDQVGGRSPARSAWCDGALPASARAIASSPNAGEELALDLAPQTALLGDAREELLA